MHTDVAVGTNYYYTIRAVNVIGETSTLAAYVNATP